MVAVPFAEAGDEAGKPGPRGKHVCKCVGSAMRGHRPGGLVNRNS